MRLAEPRSLATSAEVVLKESRTGEPLLRVASLLLVAFLVAGFGLAQGLLQGGAGKPQLEQEGVFFFLFASHEPIHFAILSVLGAALGALLFTGHGSLRADARERLDALGWPAIALLGVAVLAVTGIGARLVMHSYPLAMDEFAADFQARVFAAGQISAGIPPEWLPFAEALTPKFIAIGAEGDTWSSGYLPVAAAIRALFVLAGAPDLTNPVLAGLTIPILWLVARRLWPGERATPVVTTILLAASPQFLFTSMTAYAMPAHLLLNMTWLYLYLVGTRVSLAAAGLVGVLALGLHQPNVHALFVLPFLARLVFTRRWRTAAYFATNYLLGVALWIGWLVRFNPSGRALSGTMFALPDAFQFLLQPMNLGLLLSWQSIAMSLLVLVATLRWRMMSNTLRDVTLGVLLTLAFYVFVNFEQGHGWGYRYAYGVLGNVALLGGHGWTVLNEEWKRSGGLAFLVVSVLVALAVQTSIRATQIESFVRPFADSMAVVRSLPADVALVQRTSAWYARDLVRNDPGLTNRPKVMLEDLLAGEQSETLNRLGTVRRVEPKELGRTGMTVRPPEH